MKPDWLSTFFSAGSFVTILNSQTHAASSMAKPKDFCSRKVSHLSCRFGLSFAFGLRLFVIQALQNPRCRCLRAQSTNSKCNLIWLFSFKVNISKSCWVPSAHTFWKCVMFSTHGKRNRNIAFPRNLFVVKKNRPPLSHTTSDWVGFSRWCGTLFFHQGGPSSSGSSAQCRGSP